MKEPMRLFFGTETELGLALIRNPGTRAGYDDHLRLRAAKAAVGGGVPAWPGTETWDPNTGSRLYVDVGEHPEMTTSAADTGHRVVLQERFLETKIAARLRDVEARLGGDYTIWLTKNNSAMSAGHGVVAYGWHENYLASYSLAEDGRPNRLDILAALLPFMVTRQIVGGSGSVVRDESARGWHFELAQRSLHIVQNYAVGATRYRGFIKDRHDPEADWNKYQRFEVVFGDANVLYQPAAAKLDLTGLLVRMADIGFPLPVIALEQPVYGLHQVAKRGPHTALKLVGGRSISAIDVQLQYLQAAEAFVEETGWTEYLPSLAYWKYVLLALQANNQAGLVGLVDWVTKQDQLEQVRDRRGSELRPALAVLTSVRYHAVIGDPKGGAQEVRREHDPAGLAGQITALGSQPTNWRAAVRAAVAGEVETGDEYHSGSIGWWSIGRSQGGIPALKMKDPFTPPEEFGDWMEAVSSLDAARSAGADDTQAA